MRSIIRTIVVTLTLAAAIVALGLAGLALGEACASGVRVLPVGVKYPAAIERYRYQVRRFFPKGRDGCTDRGVQQRALAVLWAESGRNPSCVNPAHLEAVTGAENCRRSRVAKLTRDQVAEIRGRYAASDVKQSVLAAEYGVTQTTVSRIALGTTWGAGQ